MLDQNRDTLLNRTGLGLEKLAGKLVLDAGCGMGRFLEVVSRDPSVSAVGFDLSLAVESAYANIGSRPNVNVIQADIMKPPFQRGSFDVIYSVGVLHHTGDPEAAFDRLVPLLKKEGQIAIWVYSKPAHPSLSDFYRIFTSRMPWNFVLALSRLLVKTYRLNTMSNYVQVVLPISQLANPEQRLLDTYDWYSPKYQFKFTKSEIIAWFRRARLKNLKVLSDPVSVSGTSQSD